MINVGGYLECREGYLSTVGGYHDAREGIS